MPDFLAGTPAYIWFSSMSLVTTDPTSAIDFGWAVTGLTMQCPTSHTSSIRVRGLVLFHLHPASVSPYLMCVQSWECAPMPTLLPMVTLPVASIIVNWPHQKLWPILHEIGKHTSELQSRENL